MPAASAAGSLCLIAAQAPPGPGPQVPGHEQEHEDRDDHRVAEVGRVARRRSRAGGSAGCAPRCRCSRVKPPPPLGKFTVARTTVIAPASISVISARYRPRSRSAGSPMSGPDHHRDQPRLEQDERVGLAAGEQQPGGHPGADRQHRDLAEGDQADPADQQPEPERRRSSRSPPASACRCSSRLINSGSANRANSRSTAITPGAGQLRRSARCGACAFGWRRAAPAVVDCQPLASLAGARHDLRCRDSTSSAIAASTNGVMSR